MFIMDAETELTGDMLQNFIKKHKVIANDLNYKMKMYQGDHDILSQDPKPSFKPDNRLVANYAKYIVDTLNGYFIGNPVKTTHADSGINEYIDMVEKYNNQDDNNAELSKLCSIYGYAYELLYVDENAQPGISYIPPTEAFIIYDNSILQKPLYAVRYFENEDREIEGTYSDANYVYYFKITNDLNIYDQIRHYFGDVPIIEYVENEERQGAFENVETLINANNKILSEKANDVDYFADAYLKVLGVDLEDPELEKLRDTRIINLPQLDKDIKIEVGFLEKPNSDETQEHLLERLEKLIFQLSMVANINDENFGNATGISLKYKLQSMDNLAATKERKFVGSMNRRWKLISNLPNSKLKEDDWIGLSYRFTRNIPANLLEETQIAQGLRGITSEETQLKVLSLVENVKEEQEKKKAELEDSGANYIFGHAHEEEEGIEEDE